MTDEQWLDLIETTAPEELTGSPRARSTAPASVTEIADAAGGRSRPASRWSSIWPPPWAGSMSPSTTSRAAPATRRRRCGANPALPMLGWVLCLVLRRDSSGLVLALLAVTVPPVPSDAHEQQHGAHLRSDRAAKAAAQTHDAAKPASGCSHTTRKPGDAAGVRRFGSGRRRTGAAGCRFSAH